MPKSKKIIYCPVCQKVFSNRSSLSVHRNKVPCRGSVTGGTIGAPLSSVLNVSCEASCFTETHFFKEALPSDNSGDEGNDDGALDIMDDRVEDFVDGIDVGDGIPKACGKVVDDTVCNEEEAYDGYAKFSHGFLNWMSHHDPLVAAAEDPVFSRIRTDNTSEESSLGSYHSDDSSTSSVGPVPKEGFDVTPLPTGESNIFGFDSTVDENHMYQASKFSDLCSGDLHASSERLMNYIKEHCLPPSLYDFVHKWANDAVAIGYDFQSSKARTITKKMKKKYSKYLGDPPKTVYTTIMDHLPASPITSWDIKSQIRRMVSDPTAIVDASWEFSMQNDPATGERVYGEFSSSDWWERADSMIPEIKQPNHYLFPISLFIDGAHLDNIGRMVVEPCIIELLAFSYDVRRTDKSKCLLGFIPAYPMLTAEKNLEAKSVKSKYRYMEFYHRVLRIILQDLLEMEKDPNGFEVDIPGKGICFLHCRLAFIVGDIKGQCPMACHYGSFSSNVGRILPSCDCPYAHSDQCIEYPCQAIDKKEIDDTIDRCINTIVSRTPKIMGNARDELASISKKAVVSAFREFSFGGAPLGIYGALPIETLHCWMLGLMEYMLEGVYSHVTPSNRMSRWLQLRYTGDRMGDMEYRPETEKYSESMVKTDQAEFERRIKMAKDICTRQSDRDIPKTPFNNGVTSLSRLTGQEYPGLVMLTMVTLDGMLPNKTSYNNALCKKFAKLLWLTLSLNVCINKPLKTVSQVKELHEKVKIYIILYRECIGPQRETRSSCGLRLVKLHALTHFSAQYFEFGCSANYFGGHFESCIKTMAKQNLQRTSKKHGHYHEELVERYYEQQVSKFSEMVLDVKEFNKSTTVFPKHDDIILVKMSDSGFNVVWVAQLKKWCTRGKKIRCSKKLFHPLCDKPLENSWFKAITRYLDGEKLQCAKIGFKVTITDPNDLEKSDIFRCHPDIFSDMKAVKPWYDFANVLFDMGNGVLEKYPARIRVLFEVTKTNGESEVLCVVQEFTNNSKSSRTASKLIPCLQQDRLSKNIRVVTASSLEAVFLLPCTFPTKAEDCVDFLVFPPQQVWDTIGWD